MSTACTFSVRWRVVSLCLVGLLCRFTPAQDAPAEPAPATPQAPAPAPAAAPPDVAARVDRAFGDRLRAVAATRSPEDDVALAVEMLRTAEATQDDAAVTVELCERVYLLASRHGDGLPTAVAAMRLASQRDPSRRASCLERAVAAQQRRYAAATTQAQRATDGQALMDLLNLAAAERFEAGDDAAATALYKRALAVGSAVRAPGDELDAIRARITAAANRPRLLARADQLKERLAQDPTDAAAARELVDLYIVALDRPDEARKYTFLLKDEAMQRVVRLAATPRDQLDPAGLLAVGDYYRSLYQAAPPDARAKVLVNAYKAYAQWLDVAPPDAAERARVDVARRDAAGQLRALGVDAASLYVAPIGNRITVAVAPLRALEGHTGEWVGPVAFSPDGRSLVTAGADHTVRIWDVATARLTDTVTLHKGAVYAAAVSPDGQSIASLDEKGGSFVYGIDGKRPRARFDAPNPSLDLVWTPDGQRLVTASDGGARVWTVANPRDPAVGPPHDGKLWSVAVAPSGRVLVSGGQDGAIRFADAITGRLLAEQRTHRLRVSDLLLTADGRWLISCSDDGTIAVCDAQKQTPYGLIDRIDVGIRRIALSGDGRLLAAACYDGSVRVYDVHHRTLAARFASGSDKALGVAFDPGGARIATTGYGAAVHLWTLDRKEAPPGEPVTRDLTLKFFAGLTEANRVRDEGARLDFHAAGELTQPFFAHADGEYEVRLTASADLAGDEPPKLGVSAGEAAPVLVTVSAAKKEPTAYVARLKLARGPHTLKLAYANDFYDPNVGDRNIYLYGVKVVGPIEPVPALAPAPP